MTTIKTVMMYVVMELVIAGLVALACFIFDGTVEVGGLLTKIYVSLCIMWDVFVGLVGLVEEVDK